MLFATMPFFATSSAMVLVMAATAPLEAVYPAAQCVSFMRLISVCWELTQTLHANVGHHGRKVDDPATHPVLTWLLFQKLLNGVFRTKKDAACIDAHVSVECILVDLVDGLRVVRLATDARIVHDTFHTISNYTSQWSWIRRMTYMSSLPYVSTVFAMRAFQLSALLTSTSTKMVLPPFWEIHS